MREDHEKLERCLDAVQTAFAKSVKQVRGPAPLKQITREQVCHWHIKDKPELPDKHPNTSEIWQAKIRTYRGDDLYLTLYLWHGMSLITKELVTEWIERHVDVGVMGKLEKFSIPDRW